ncbi:MAG: hypothetical protein AB8B61_09195 [Cyclobacteriaceae bacterium]
MIIPEKLHDSFQMVMEIMNTQYNHRDINFVQEHLIQLCSISGLVAETLAISTENYNIAKNESYEKNKLQGLKVAELQSIIDKECCNEEAIKIYCKTIEQHLRSHIDSARTIISYQKSELENSLKTSKQ